MIKRITSERFRFKARKIYELKEYWADTYRYLKFANFGFNYKYNEDMYCYLITKYYHIIEKGLTMPETRIGFGKDALLRLVSYLKEYYSVGFNVERAEVIHAISVLNEYVFFSKVNNHTLSEAMLNSIAQLSIQYKVPDKSAQHKVEKSLFFQSSKDGFEQFFLSRASVRNYTDRDIELDILKRCVALAMKSPSACNRQPNKVHVLKNRTLIDKVLLLQSGNRGFGNLCNTLLVVSVDIAAFYGSYERFAPHFNSGMFAMSLVNALHFFEIGSCVLNWSTTNQKDKEIRALLQIPDSEYVTVLISCGYPPDEFKVALSPRRNPDSITSYHL